jgi:replication factor C subunit 3/5
VSPQYCCVFLSATSSNLPHLTVIEKHTRSTRFALICNHVNKIIPALQSRCTRFRFAPLDGTHVRERLKHIIQSEGLDVDDGGLTALVRLSNGDMRKALNILQVMCE